MACFCHSGAAFSQLQSPLTSEMLDESLRGPQGCVFPLYKIPFFSLSCHKHDID